MNDDICHVAVFENDLVKKMSVKEKLKFSKWPKEKREKLVETMTKIKQQKVFGLQTRIKQIHLD